MQWYYAHNNQQAGPVDEAELRSLFDQGVIVPGTLVWHEGMADWQPYGAVVKGATASPFPKLTSPSGSSSSGPAANPTMEANVVCPNCGARTDPRQLIPLGSTTVCPRCRDAYSQRLKEGGSSGRPGDWEFAGFWTRAGAYLIDYFILNVVQFGLAFIVGFAMASGAGSNPDTLTNVDMIASLISIVIGVSYTVFFLGSPRFQATPGMMALKIRIIVADGSDCSTLRAFGRMFAAILSSLIMGIGYLMCAWDEERRTLHDRICDTRVIRNR